MNTALTILVIAFSHFLVDVMVVLFALYKTMAQLDLGYAGLLAAISAVIGESFQILWGSLSDRGWRKFLIFGGVLLSCCSVFLPYAASNYLLLFFCLLFTFIGSGAFHPCAAALVSSLSEQRKGLFLTLFAAGGALGTGLGQLIFYYSYNWLDGQLIWLALPSFILVLCMLPVSIGKPQTPIVHRPHSSFRAILNLFQNRSLRYLYIALVCNQTLLFGSMFLLPDALMARGSENWISFGGGHMSLILGGALLLIPAGYLADRFSSRAVMLWAMGLGLILFYTFLLLPIQEPTRVLGLLFCLGAAFFVVQPVGIAFANREMPDQPGIVSAFTMGMVWVVAESIGPTTALLTYVFKGPEGPLYALMVLASINVIGFWATWKLPSGQEAAVPAKG